MFAEVPLFPDQASTLAPQVDALYIFLWTVSGGVVLLVMLFLLYFLARYRRRSERDRTPRIVGSLRLELLWTFVPLVIFLGVFVWGASIYFAMARPPDDALEVYVVAKQWMWKLQHQGGQREINELHVPVGRPVKLIMTSEDVIHSFFVPDFRLKQDVLPGRYLTSWFEATKPGRFDLYCAEYCGTSHSGMIGKVIVLEPAEYDAWLNAHAEGSLALEGRKLFLKLQCLSCHSGDAQARGPLLENLYGRQVPLQDGRTVLADEAYLRESILTPRARIAQGWQPIMPTFQGQVDEMQLIQLIAFLRALGPGQTPVRNEEFPPPVVDPNAPESKEKKP